jgi:hypothetical protein
MDQTLQLSPSGSLVSFLAEGELVALNVGPDGLVYAVIALRPLDYQIEQLGWAVFPKTVPDRPQKYRVVALSGDKVVRVHCPGVLRRKTALNWSSAKDK